MNFSARILVIGSFLLIKGFVSTAQICPVTVGSELITNGDFSAGNTGFASDYNLTTGSPPSIGVAGYGVWTNPNATNTGYFANMGDHTSGTGNMMIIDVDGNVGKDVYRTNVTVTANTTYFFSAWFANINLTTSCGMCTNAGYTQPAGCPTCSPTGTKFENSPQLKFSINGAQVGSVIRVDSTNHNWGQFYYVWYSGAASGAITIRIENVVPTSNGNDLALDDISFSTGCNKISNLSTYGRNSTMVDTIYACNVSFPQVLNTQLTNGNYTFQWRDNGGALIGGATSNTYTIPTAPAVTTKYFVCYDSIADGINGCFKTDTVVIIPGQLTINLGADLTLCDPINHTINSYLTASGISYVWTWNGSPIGGALSASYTATQVGTYTVTATKAGCTAGADNVVISRVTPSLSGSGMYCSGPPPSIVVSVSGANVLNGVKNLVPYLTSSGGSPTAYTAINDSTFLISGATNFTTAGSCTTGGIYIQDNNSFNSNVTPVASPAANESVVNGGAVSTEFVVFGNSVTLNSVDIYQHNYSTGGTSTYTVTIYTNAAGSACSGSGDVPSSTVVATVSVSYSQVSVATLRSIPLNIMLPGSVAGTKYWIQISGAEFSYFSTAMPYPATPTPSPTTALQVLNVIQYGCYKAEAGNVAAFHVTAGKTNSCGRQFICATLPCALPVELMNLTLVTEPGQNKLLWDAVGEMDILRYVVQCSYDGEGFHDLGLVEATCSATEVCTYSYQHATSAAVVYYRLRIEERSEVSYSEVLVAHQDGDLVLAPVPASGLVKLTLNEPIRRIHLLDLIGRVVYHAEVDGEEASLDVSSFSGTYVVEVYSASGSLYRKKVVVE